MVASRCRPHGGGLLVAGIALAVLGFALLIAATMGITAAPALAWGGASSVAEAASVRPSTVVRAVRRPGRWRRPDPAATRSEPARYGFGRAPASLRPAVVSIRGERAMFIPPTWYGESGAAVMGPRLARPPDDIREEFGNAQRWRRRIAPAAIEDPQLPAPVGKEESAGRLGPPRPMDRLADEGTGLVSPSGSSLDLRAELAAPRKSR